MKCPLPTLLANRDAPTWGERREVRRGALGWAWWCTGREWGSSVSQRTGWAVMPFLHALLWDVNPFHPLPPSFAYVLSGSGTFLQLLSPLALCCSLGGKFGASCFQTGAQSHGGSGQKAEGTPGMSGFQVPVLAPTDSAGQPK